MKIRLYLLMIALLIITLISAACQPQSQPQDTNITPKPGVSNDIDTNNTNNTNKNYSITTLDSVPEDVQDWFDSFNGKKGAYAYQHPDYTYLMINAGKRSTGGYGIEIKNFIDNLYEKVVTVEFTSPKKGDIVTDAITYPYVLLNIKSNTISKYIIKTTGGETLNTEEKVIFSQVYSPKVNDTIKSPIKVKGKIAAFEGSFVIRILDSTGKKLKEQVVQTEGAPTWGSFDEKIEFSKPTTPEGFIEIGEYSAEDGHFISRNKIKVNFS